MKSNFFKPVSCLLGIGVLTIVSHTLSVHAEPPPDLASIPSVEPTQPPSSFVDLLGVQAVTNDSVYGKQLESKTQTNYQLVKDLQPNGEPLPSVTVEESVGSTPTVKSTVAPGSFVDQLGMDQTTTQTSDNTVSRVKVKQDTLAKTQPSDIGVEIVEPQAIAYNSTSEPQKDAIAAVPIPGTVATSADLLKVHSQTPEVSTVSSQIQDTRLAQRDLDIRRGTVGVPNYIGIGGNIGLSSGDDNTTLGDGGFVINGKLGLASNLSLRPSVILGNDAIFLIPLTYDFLIPRVDPFEPIRFAPFAGGGVAISTDDDNSIGFLLTVGVDVPLSRAFVANAALNLGFIEDTTDFGIILGVGYTFRN